MSKSSKNQRKAKGKSEADSPLSKSSVFRRPSTQIRYGIVFNKIHSGERFEKLRFRHHFHCIRVDDNRIHIRKVAFLRGRGLNKVAVARF